MPIIQNEIRVVGIAITTASGNFTVVSASITQGSPPQTLRGPLSTSTVSSSGVASHHASPPSDTSITQTSSTNQGLPISTIFAIALGGAALAAAVLCFTFWACRCSPPAPPSVDRARYLRKRRPPRSMSNAWSIIEPVVSPNNVDGFTARHHTPKEKSTPAATSPPPQPRLSGFRIPRKAPPRLPSWALSTQPEIPNIPEIRSPEPFRMITDPILVRAPPQARIREIPPTPELYPLASSNLLGLGVGEPLHMPHQTPYRSSFQASPPYPGQVIPNLTTLRGPALSSSASLSSWSTETLSVFPVPPKAHPSQTLRRNLK